mgnify:CR=1 FL=1|jgi:hypothetical protein
MRSIIYSFILICCFASVNLIAQEDGPPHAFKQSKKLLNGTWHVVATNCPELVNSDKDTVKLVFSNFKIKNGKMTFDESLIYYKNKNRKIQKANNLMKSQMQLNFIWTGLGNFDVMNRKWRVIASDSEGKWLVVQFFKTKAKFKGIAVIVRDKNISEQQLQDIITYVAKSYLMPSLTTIK